MSLRSSRNPCGRIAYVDGRYVPHGTATVHIEDRGLQFADSVYEVFSVSRGRLLETQGHLDRLERSLAALSMPMPMTRAALAIVIRETLRRNRIADGIVYLQVTRGAYRRDHAFPDPVHPSLIVTVRRLDTARIERRRAEGVAVITRSDIRWGRCDIKSTSLLPNIMTKTEALKSGAYETWLVDRDGGVTEGSSSNAWIVKDGVAITRDLSSAILAGVTRAGVLAAMAEGQLRAEERAFTLAEAYAADEAFVTSASGGVIPVVRIDGRPVDAGKPGPVTRRIHELYQARAESDVRNREKTL